MKREFRIILALLLATILLFTGLAKVNVSAQMKPGNRHRPTVTKTVKRPRPPSRKPPRPTRTRPPCPTDPSSQNSSFSSPVPTDPPSTTDESETSSVPTDPPRTEETPTTPAGTTTADTETTTETTSESTTEPTTEPTTTLETTTLPTTEPDQETVAGDEDEIVAGDEDEQESDFPVTGELPPFLYIALGLLMFLFTGVSLISSKRKTKKH